MRIKIKQTKNQGSVLLVTLCTAWVIGIALVSYLTLVANQNRTTYHSQSWSGCIPVLEAGIEEALTQLNFNNAEGFLNYDTHGWTKANGLYTKTRTVSDTDGTYCIVTIDPNTNGIPATPIIISQGYVPAPGFTGKTLGGESAFGMILATVGQSTPAMICRTVKVGTTFTSASGPGLGGIRTKGTINFSGGGSLDSFDSSDPRYSTNGQYDSTKRRANGKALSNSSVADAIHVDTAFIFGSVTTGTGGTVTVNSGAVGDAAFNAAPTVTPHIQAGHKTDDANVQFDPVVEPFVWGTGSTPIAGTVSGTNYTYVLNGAANSKYNLGSVNIGGGKSIVVTGGDVTLYISGNFTTSGSGFVYVAPGASLKLYTTATFTVSGTGVMNGTGLASNLSIFGLGTVKENWAYSGSSSFIGTVYSPYDQFTFSGSAGAMGSFSANNVVISGGAAVHYDEHLSSTPSIAEYVAISWNEI
jgi:hypothetical protein